MQVVYIANFVTCAERAAVRSSMLWVPTFLVNTLRLCCVTGIVSVVRQCLYSLWMRESQNTDLLEDSKLALGLKVECLRFWRACSMHGFGFTCLRDIFPCMCRDLLTSLPLEAALNASSSLYTLSKEMYLTFAVILGNSTKASPGQNHLDLGLQTALLTASSTWIEVDFLSQVGC